MGAKSPAHPLGSFIGRKIPSAPLTGNPRSAKLCTKRNISVTLITKERLPDLLLKPYWYGGRAKNSPISGPYKSELLHGEWGRHGRISYSRRDNHFLSKRRGRHRWCGGTCSPYADFATQIRQHDSQSQCITAQRLAKSAQSHGPTPTVRLPHPKEVAPVVQLVLLWRSNPAQQGKDWPFLVKRDPKKRR